MKRKTKPKALKTMKLGPITIGGRRDGSGYQHSTASIVITPEDGDTAEDCMARATETLALAFDAAEQAVEKRPARANPASAVQRPVAPAPATSARQAAPPLQSFPTTEVGKLAKEIVTKATPTGKAPKATPAAPSPNPAPTAAPSDEEGLKRRVAAWRKSLAEQELSEGDFLKACGVSTPEELPQLKAFGITQKQLKAFVDDVAGILANADDVKM